ncbi:hypothetical protein Leryth_011932, partial [Lithospermum erythrorhizon]
MWSSLYIRSYRYGCNLSACLETKHEMICKSVNWNYYYLAVSLGTMRIRRLGLKVRVLSM